MDSEDIRLLEFFKKDEREAFRELFVRYYKPMVLAAKLYTSNSTESEDIVQQVFVKVWEEKLHTRISASIKNYLHVSVRNACFNHLELLSVKQKDKLDSDAELQVEHAIDFILKKEEVKVFQEAYKTLPEQSRKVFELIYLEGQQYKTAAKTLSLSVNTIKSHLQNAIRILKNNPVIINHFSERKKS